MKIVALFQLLPLSMMAAASPKYMNLAQWMKQQQQTFALDLGSECNSRI
jgi:hypothetical protein